jgi:hypothetical protein
MTFYFNAVTTVCAVRQNEQPVPKSERRLNPQLTLRSIKGL